MTNETQLVRQLKDSGISVREQEPLAPYTTFRIGGPARVLCTAENAEQTSLAMAAAKTAGVRLYVLGRGSNTLFADEGFDGMVLLLHGAQIRADPDVSDQLTAEAGAGLTVLCRKAQEAGLSGLEFAYGIPGSVGGAVFMNAGAYHGEMKDVVSAVDYLDPQDGSVHRLSANELDFGYRMSRFQTKGGIILNAQFTLQPGDKEEIRRRMEELFGRRVEKQPLDKPSAGSTFKRPKGAYAAALIEQCGLKGFRAGGAAVSDKHAGFVVNLGGATCADVIAVADQVAAVVKEKTGFDLEREIRVVR